jgi:hypothetical protein
MVEGNLTSDGRDWTCERPMSITPTQLPADLVIDLTTPTELPTGHRLAELVQALTGCSVERAELAISDPTPGPASSDDALEAMARALVWLRPRQPA